jgi:hypothetical protein
MKSFYQFGKNAPEKRGTQPDCHAIFVFVLLVVGFGMARTASAQVVYTGDKGGISLTAGITASGYEVQYGQQKLLGFAGVVDVDTPRRFGLEAEGRWLMFHNPTQIETRTYMGGPRYHFTKGKLQFYGKGLVGVGQFTFPYDLAQGNYLVIAPGGGVDYRWKRRISFRLADFEYQIWPQFTYNGSSYESMNSYGISAGVRYHIF